MSNHKQRGRHRAAAFHQTTSTMAEDQKDPLADMFSFIDQSLERHYAQQERNLKKALENGDKSYTIKSMIGNLMDAKIDLRDRHPFNGEPLDEE